MLADVVRSSIGGTHTRGCFLQRLCLAVAVYCCLSRGQAALYPPGAHSWSFFNIQRYSFVGSWNNVTYQSEVWLRALCHNSSSHSLRMLVFIHNTPYIITSPEGVHSLTPASFLAANGTLPLVWLESDNGQLSVTASVLNQYDELVKQQEDAAALVLTAELPADVLFTLRMEGSERVHYLPSRCSPRAHPLFAKQSVWLGVVDGSTARPAPVEHTRLAGRIPPPTSRQKHNNSDSADENTFSAALLHELASLLDLTSSTHADDSHEAAQSDRVAREEDTVSGDSSSVDIDSSDIVAVMAQLQQLQQRRLLQHAPGDAQDNTAQNRSRPLTNSSGAGPSTMRADTLYSSSTTAAASPTSTVTLHRKIHMRTAGGRENTSPVAVQEYRSSNTSTVNNRESPQPPGPSNSSSLKNHSNDSSTRANIALESSHRGAVLRFLTLQHLAHHRNLGFSGSIMVVTQHTAEQLLQSRYIRKAVQRQRLVLVIWDSGLEPRASHFQQVPAYNLIRLAAWGSTAALGFWDLDEYLVLPNHKPINHEVFQGCMQSTWKREPEALLRSMWVKSVSWNSSAELAGWMQHGSWLRAVQSMNYSMWPYTYCDGTCKAIVDPNTDLLFQVHQHARPPPRDPVLPVDWRCGYMLHFYQLWGPRAPELMADMYEQGAAGVPLIVEDMVPQAIIKQLASAAKLYETIISSNPALAYKVFRP